MGLRGTNIFRCWGILRYNGFPANCLRIGIINNFLAIYQFPDFLKGRYPFAQIVAFLVAPLGRFLLPPHSRFPVISCRRQVFIAVNPFFLVAIVLYEQFYVCLGLVRCFGFLVSLFGQETFQIHVHVYCGYTVPNVSDVLVLNAQLVFNCSHCVLRARCVWHLLGSGWVQWSAEAEISFQIGRSSRSWRCNDSAAFLLRNSIFHRSHCYFRIDALINGRSRGCASVSFLICIHRRLENGEISDSWKFWSCSGSAISVWSRVCSEFFRWRISRLIITSIGYICVGIVSISHSYHDIANEPRSRLHQLLCLFLLEPLAFICIKHLSLIVLIYWLGSIQFIEPSWLTEGEYNWIFDNLGQWLHIILIN